MGLLVDAFWLTVVALLWGGTNPFLKSGGAGIEKVKHSNAICQFLAELWFLVANWRYMVPFLLNQSGSVVFYLSLSSADLSIAVPLTNALTFIITCLVGRWLGERTGSTEAYMGMCLVVIGLAFCIYAKTPS